MQMQNDAKEIVIGICDDQEFAINELQQIIVPFLERRKTYFRLETFGSGEEVIAYSQELDILFLDIEMPGMDGIEVGTYVSKNRPGCKIIMATSRKDRYREAFKISAFRFAEKPFDADEILEYIDDAMSRFIGYETIECFCNRISYTVCQREIIYVQAFDSAVELLVGDKRMRKETSVSKMEQEIDSRLFYRVNRKYLVNMQYVEEINRNMLTIAGEKIKIARDKVKDFEKAYIEFDLKYRG